jgi:hypothetical protein
MLEFAINLRILVMFIFRIILFFTVLNLFAAGIIESAPALYLKDNLKRAQKDDYIITAQNKNYTLFHIYDKKDDTMTIEEITVPLSRFPRSIKSWKQWISLKAPGNTSWVMYTLNLKTAQMLEFYSLSKNAWFEPNKTDNFLTTLLNLHLDEVALKDRKKVGFPTLPGMTDRRPLWQPRMIVDGTEVLGVSFTAWTTHWPNDGTDLAGKTIEVYVPEQNDKYPSYFPYWLQISGMIGKAKVRIIDSGSKMSSPAPPLEAYKNQVINKKANEM